MAFNYTGVRYTYHSATPCQPNKNYTFTNSVMCNEWLQTKDIEIKASLDTCDVSVTMLHEAGCFKNNYGIFARALRNNYLISGGVHLFFGVKVCQLEFGLAIGLVALYVWACIGLGLIPFIGMFWSFIVAYFLIWFWLPPLLVYW